MDDTYCQWIQESPFGPLLIETSADGVRFVGLRGSAASEASVCKDCENIQDAFERYFAGNGEALSAVPVDLRGARSEFARKVLSTLHDTVPPGSVTTYAELAAASGHPGAARAVGSAMATNPVPIVVPCHRVLAADGSLGGYGGGIDMKQRLLEIEGAIRPGKSSQAAYTGRQSR